MGGDELKKPIQAGAVQATEKITRATEYVERVCAQPTTTTCFPYQYYVVLETERGHTIVAEFSSGKAKWEENPANLEDRNSLAKVLRASERCAGVTIGDMKAQHASTVPLSEQDASCTCKHVAR